jgi:hypothetical protein
MRNDDVRRGIGRSWRLASQIDLMLDVSSELPLLPSDEFRSFALDQNRRYEEVYLCGLRNKDYNFSLVDYSFFQFGISRENHVRYAYYPNPFLGSSPEKVKQLNDYFDAVEDGTMSFEDYLAEISIIKSSNHSPLVRYENAPDEYVQWKHPTSHFHLGDNTNNRWPLGRSLTPLAFSLIIFKQFYSEAWHDRGEIHFDGSTKSLDQRLCDEKLNCRIVPDSLLSKDEKLQFVFF